MKKLLIAFAFFVASSICAQEVQVVAHAQKLKGHYFNLRAHEELFGSPDYSGWDARPIYTIYADDQKLKWAGKYFVSETEFRVKDVDFNKKADSILLKMWTPDRRELRFYFLNAKAISPNAFDAMFYQIFFRPGEDVKAFVDQNNKLLIQAYLDAEPELSILTIEDRIKILSAIKSIGSIGTPKLNRLEGGLYLPANLHRDSSVYNDLRVSKNQRIASTIESKMGGIKDAAKATADLPTIIRGVRFYWRTLHRDFLKETHGTPSEMELLAPLKAIKEFADGNLSAFEFVNLSLLRVDGTKITLTSWDPIGAR